MPLRSRKPNKKQEKDAYKRGKHDRRKGKGLHHNPFVRSQLDHEPNLYDSWESGWHVMDAQISAGNIEEYDNS